MHYTDPTHSKIGARDAALRLMNRLTAGVTVAAVAGVGGLGYIAAATHPGTSAAITSSSTASTSTSAGSSSALQASTGAVSSSTSTAVVVSGGSK